MSVPPGCAAPSLTLPGTAVRERTHESRSLSAWPAGRPCSRSPRWRPTSPGSRRRSASAVADRGRRTSPSWPATSSSAGGKRLRPVVAMAAARHPPRTRRGPTTSCRAPSRSSSSTSARSTTTTSWTRPTPAAGVETVNAKWGNLQAILAGDFLLARASEIAASLGTEIAALLAATIGRLCYGQIGELRTDLQRRAGPRPSTWSRSAARRRRCSPPRAASARSWPASTGPRSRR